MSRHDRLTTLKRRATAVAEDWLGCAQLVLALKFKRWWELARPLGAALRGRCGRRGGRLSAGAVVVPVPMPLIRRWRWGIDHAALIGREVASTGGATYYAAMWRSRGAGQAGAVRSARLRASSRGWHLHLKAPSRLQGREVVIVDDVLTTGRTARIASRLLKQAGAISVTLAMVAVTDQSPDIGHKSRVDGIRILYFYVGLGTILRSP